MSAGRAGTFGIRSASRYSAKFCLRGALDLLAERAGRGVAESGERR